MTGKRRWTWLLGVLAMAAGVSMMIAAYGAAGTKHQTAATKPIGTLRAVIDTIDYLDPQQAYTGQSWWAMWNVYETLLTYKHVDGPAGYKLVPGLAASLPTVSRNGKVYKFKLRKGLRYSNGKALKASDFKWAIKRGFLAQGQGVGFYTDIAGAKAYAAHPTPGGNISGIIVNNQKRTITNKHAARRLPHDPRAHLRGAGPGQHRAGDPERVDPGNGAVQVPELRPEPELRDGAEQVLQEDEVHPARHSEPGRGQPDRRRRRGNPEGDERPGRLLERRDPARPDRGREEQGPSGPS